MSITRPYTEDSLYDQLVRFIRLNKTVAEFPANVPPEEYEKNIASLREAISQNHAQAEIFNNPACLLYLLALIKNKEVDNNKALTMITWLIAKQSKAYGNIEVIDINQNEELRSDFIKEMYYHALITGKKLNEEQIKQEIATYRGLDAWAFVVPYPDSSS